MRILKIVERKTAKSENTDRIGKLNLMITLIDGATHWVSLKQWLGDGHSTRYAEYVGGDYTPTYMEVGDTMFSGAICTKANTILDEFTASVNPDVLALARVYAENKADEARTADMLAFETRQARRRAARAEALAGTTLVNGEHIAPDGLVLDKAELDNVANTADIAAAAALQTEEVIEP
jgi:hypothetical protein